MYHGNTYFNKFGMPLKTQPFTSKKPSENNCYMAYVCLVKDGILRNSSLGQAEQATDDEEQDFDDTTSHVQVETSKAAHELVESTRNTDHNIIKAKRPIVIAEESETSDQDDEANRYDNPKKLKLTRMKWLSEYQSRYTDSSSPSVSSARSTSSSKAEESDDDGEKHPNVGEKCLSTILRLDKEHNLFGMSSIAVVGSKQSRPTKQSRKDDEKPVFHQTAIVQVCCNGSPCRSIGCKHKSKTDLPCSIKNSGCRSCGSCFSCYLSPPCPRPRPSPPRVCKPTCMSSCPPCVVRPPSCAFIPRTPLIHASCVPDNPMMKLEPVCEATCNKYEPPKKSDKPSSCVPLCCKPTDCTCGLTAFVPPEPPQCCYGLKIKLNRRPDYKPAPHELTPRCASELQKPLMARPCTHTPCCQPPSATYPYLMPCYWPCRPNAPCLDPTRCFHHPPCLPPRRPKGFVPLSQECPKPGPCSKHPKGCRNKSCLGTNVIFQKGLAEWGSLPKPFKESPNVPPKPPAPQPGEKQPGAKQPGAKQPGAKQPAAKQPAAPQPEAKQPAAPQPEAKQTEAKQPAAPQPEAKQPAVPKPPEKK